MMTYQHFTLSQKELDHYRDSGFLVPEYRLPDDVLARLREAYDRLLADNAEIPSDLMIGPHMSEPGAQGVKGSPEWLDFVTQPELLDIAQQLIGEDLILWATTIFGKPAKGGKVIPWHQDGDYYPIRPLETLSIWVAIDDATLENGCMRYIPGSHRAHKIFSHHWDDDPEVAINLACDAEHYDESTAYDLVLEAGQVAFHDVYMIHGSRANRSNQRRAALIARIMPGNCFYDHDYGTEKSKPHEVHDYANRPLYLLRGQDRTGRNNFQIGH